MARPRAIPWYTAYLLLVATLVLPACARGGAAPPVAPIAAEPGVEEAVDAGPIAAVPAVPGAVAVAGAAEGGVEPAARSDLGIRVRGRSSLGGAWDRLQPCDGLASQRCGASALPRVVPDLRLGVVAGGLLLNRVRLGVDYDGAREWDAANDIRVAYEGRQGEFLTRMEAGNVRLALPNSRFLAHAASAGHWGFRAVGQAGPVEMQAMWAQSGGQIATREFRVPAGGRGAVQDAVSTWDDAQFAAGQFFFLFDPAAIRGYPHIDILALGSADAPPELVPAAGVRLFRYEGGPPAQDGSTVPLRAAPPPGAAPGEEVRPPFRMLQEGIDFQLHRSGLWLILRQPLRDEEVLGVAYATAAGGVVGDEAAAGEIRLLRGARAAHRPGASTWPLEMRQVYRVTGSDAVDARSVRLTVSRGESTGGDLGRPHPATGAVIPYLQLLGLDDDLPGEQIDAVRVFRPADHTLEPVVGGVFVVFPTLRPFAEPPPVRSLGFSAADAALALGSAANPALYAAADDRAFAEAARFRLMFRFAARGGTDAGLISLGAIGIRDGSERVYLGGRLLRPGTDYTLIPETGQLELLATPVLAAGADAELRVTFEQLPLFAAMPTQVMGVAARVPLGGRGELNVVGLSQRERSLVRRPTLGTEAAAQLLGGASAEMRWGVPWLDRVLAAPGAVADPAVLSGRSTPHPEVRAVGGPAPEGRSELRLAGELAVSMPDPRGGVTAYVDDFEDRGEIAVPLQRAAWRLGSAPASRQRAETVLPEALDVPSAATLVWQHDFRGGGGRVEGSLPLSSIDRRIRVAGASQEPNVLYLSMHADAPRAWRSITSVLSPTGRDLRTTQYLEFYVAGAAPGDALVLDLGTVSEDAFAFDARGRRGGIDAEGRPWGEGVLDREWDPARESWTAARDVGLWDAQCRAEPGAVYALGDPSPSCTRGNGLPDTEDLNGNGVLDTDERVFRYVVRPADAEPAHLAADTLETGTGFRLFRISLDRAAGVGALPDEMRQVRHLRLTVVGGDGTRLTLARMRLVGSRWERRGEGGVLDGLVGAGMPGSPMARVEVGPVSRLSDGAAYVSPPGVADTPQDAASAFGAQAGAEFNEQALRVRFEGVGPGERAEVFRRYDGGPQNFLSYRQLRLWALARNGTWGAGGEALVVRVGNDPDNHYLFRGRIARVGAPAVPADWGPEIVIEFDRWIRLRAEAERRIADRPASAREPLVVWDDDGMHAIVLTDRGRAPNLAAVREISIGVWNGGPAPADGEVWINDIRLAAADRRPGLAGTVGVGFRAGGAVDADLSVTRRGGHFRELSAAPSYLAEDAVSLRATVRLDRLVGGAAGFDAPLTVALERSGAAPVFVQGTDVEARALPGLRPLGGSRVRLGLELRRSDASRRPWMRSTLDALALQFGVARSRDDSPFAASARAEASAGVTYRVQPAARTAAILPAPRMSARGALTPGGAGGDGAAALRVRWTPVHVEFGTVWSDAVGEFRHFEGLLPSAAAAPPELSATRGLAHHASVGVQPLQSLSGSVRVRSISDLLPAAARFDPTAPPGAEPFRPAGLDLGRETGRDVATQVAWAPQLNSWLTVRSTLNSAFLLDAGPGLLGATTVGGAPGGAVRSFGTRRTLAVRWGLDPVSLARAAGVADSTYRSPAAAALRSVRRMEVGWGSALDSRFDRVDARPGLPYQLGLGGRSGLGGLAAGGPSLLADRTTWTARTQLRLPGGIDASLGFSDAVGLVSGQRGERSDRTREWPALLAHWTGAPPAGALAGAVRGASVSAGYALQSRRWDDRGSAHLRTDLSSRVPLDASVQWTHGFSTAYRGEWRLTSADAPTARTERVAAEHSMSVSGSLRAPPVLEPALPAPIAVSLRYDLGGGRECRLSPESTACLVGAEFAGHRAQGWSVQADTQASGMRVGLLLDHRDRSSSGTQILDHRRFSVSLFGEFNLQAGRLP